jgi:hypothetical protein
VENRIAYMEIATASCLKIGSTVRLVADLHLGISKLKLRADQVLSNRPFLASVGRLPEQVMNRPPCALGRIVGEAHWLPREILVQQVFQFAKQSIAPANSEITELHRFRLL